MKTNQGLTQFEMRSEFLAGNSPYSGKVLRVNLSTGEIWVDEHSDDFFRKWIGGRGLIVYYLLKETAPNIDPLGPDNLLIFAPGILTGTVLPGTGRHAVGGKSPLTGALASGEAGGWWGAECKQAGFDAVVIQGKAEKPVYLWIKNGGAELRDANHLWGLKTGDCQEEIRKELNDEKIRVAQIGPAGENLVRFAAVMHDINRAAGRGGLGALMGSKNLKAVAVRGKFKIGLADKEIMKITQKWITANYKDMMGWAIQYGTSGSVKGNHDGGVTGIRNYQDGSLEGIEKLDATSIFTWLIKDRDTCNRCPVRCKLVAEHLGDVYIDPRYGGPEYESIAGLGPMCQINDPLVVGKANELCAAYGLDTISTGGTVAFTMECVDKGLLNGFEDMPKFGDGQSLLDSIEKIAHREDLGEWMAEGSARMATRIGMESDQMLAVARGQELPYHDPRLKNAIGMGYAVSATGADHMANLNDTFATWDGSDICVRLRELGIETPLKLWGISDHKIEAFFYETAFKNFLDSAVICHFYPYEFHHMVDALNAAGGWNMDMHEIISIGERIINTARMYLLREGFTAEDDMLSARLFQPTKVGPIAGKAMTPEYLKDALQKYYRRMGWFEDGFPTEETLVRLKLINL
ncbi:MAG: aldehyde ferredoxin oxidoreductase [Chloroflexi bacterium HGW-Chloroflexi-3]|nr:MAG: aldehyde ferredoxin oxidoreductase [Chloroflexi bacterium HGW-Chloroflexi-3]